MNVNDLVAAWRAADNRYRLLDNQWPKVRFVMWPSALGAIALIIANVYGPMAWLAGLLGLTAIVLPGAYLSRLHTAGAAAGRAWLALVDNPNISDAELGRLADEGVEDDGEAR